MLEEENKDVVDKTSEQQQNEEAAKKYKFEYKVVETQDQVFERNNKDDVIYLSIWGTSTEIDGALVFEVIDVADIVVEKVEPKEENPKTKDEQN